MKLTATRGGRLNPQHVIQIIRRYWSPKLAESVRQMKAICDGSGAVFDIYEDQHDRFMENYQHLLNAEGDRLDFVVERCVDLPEIDDDSWGGSY